MGLRNRWRRKSLPSDEQAHGTSKDVPPATPPGYWEATKLFPKEATIPMPDRILQDQVGLPGLFTDMALVTMGRLNMAGLRPEDSVLDIGCGVGRTARYLCDYLDTGARYEGFDIMAPLVEWCRANITPSFPNFTFTHVALFNGAYYPDPDAPSPTHFRFPYDDGTFDFVLAHSVFTHLDPSTAAHYLDEVRRVMKGHGRFYATWFLFGDRPLGNRNRVVSKMTLDDSGDFALYDARVPDAAVGYRVSFIRDLYVQHGLEIIEPIHPGFEQLQDAIVATSAGAGTSNEPAPVGQRTTIG